MADPDLAADAQDGTGPAARVPRKRSRAARRSQLIEATIEVLARRGYARMTLAEVADQAGLSHGLVNFHFQSKELLLSQTLAYLSEEYRANWTGALEAAGDAPDRQLDALIRADFAPRICTPQRLAAWCSFWGEATCRPLYQRDCGSNDEDYIRRMEAICTRLIREGGYDGQAARIARVIRVTIEGVWQDLMTQVNPYPLVEGRATVFCAAQAFFPRHFGANGLLRP